MGPLRTVNSAALEPLYRLVMTTTAAEKCRFERVMGRTRVPEVAEKLYREAVLKGCSFKAAPLCRKTSAALAAEDRFLPVNDFFGSLSSPFSAQSANSLRTPSPNRSTAAHIGNRSRSPSHESHPGCICGCFPSKWFRPCRSVPRTLRH